MLGPACYSSFVPIAFLFTILVLTNLFLNKNLKTEVSMEKDKKVNQKPKSDFSINCIIFNTLQTLWAIGTSVVATGVLN